MNFGIRNHQYKVLFYLFALVFPESIIGQQVNPNLAQEYERKKLASRKLSGCLFCLPLPSLGLCLKNMFMLQIGWRSEDSGCLVWLVLLKGFKFGGCNKIIDGKQERIAVGFGEALYLKSMLA